VGTIRRPIRAALRRAASSGAAGGHTDNSAPATPVHGPDGSTLAATSTPSTDEAQYKALVTLEAHRERIRRDARRLIDSEDAARGFTPPDYTATLTDELALPDEPVTFLVEDIIPAGANVLLAAQFKAGKTTFVSNLTRSLVDREPFLGRYDVADIDGRVVVSNYEVGRDQYKRWLRDIAIRNTDKVAILPLRGIRLPLSVPHVEDWMVAYLKDRQASVWIVDPFARAASGIDENDNTQVGVFLETLDVIKQRAGVKELILPTHTGRAEHEQGAERARGATRLDDWADVRWLLTKDGDDTRYFRATGRDVDTVEEALEFDPATRHLRLTGGDRRTNAARRYQDAVLTCVTNRPGIGVLDLRDGVRQILNKCAVSPFDAAVNALIGDRKIHTVGSSPKKHYPGPSPGTAGPDPFN
jgi:hypothetical protein